MGHAAEAVHSCLSIPGSLLANGSDAANGHRLCFPTAPGRGTSLNSSKSCCQYACYWLQVMSPEETQLPNGMGWDMAKHVMYLNDTFMKEFGDTPGIIWEIKVDQQGVPVRDASQQLQKR